MRVVPGAGRARRRQPLTATLCADTWRASLCSAGARGKAPRARLEAAVVPSVMKRALDETAGGPMAEMRKLPARTFLYCCVPREPGQPAGVALEPPLQLLRTPPAPGTGCRVCELMVERAVQLACWDGIDETIQRPPDCDGLCTVDGARIVLYDTAALRLLDDDKRAGLTQASLPDLLMRRVAAHPP